jgi:hypothetical protein
MKIPFVFCILLFNGVHAWSQNLVPNGGFEDENICTEYIKNCAPEAWIATSLFNNYYIDAAVMRNAVSAHGGTHYIGLTAGSLGMQGIRNFIRSRLLCGLRKGNRYKLVMYLHSKNPILDSIGIFRSRIIYTRKDISSL